MSGVSWRVPPFRAGKSATPPRPGWLTVRSPAGRLIPAPEDRQWPSSRLCRDDLPGIRADGKLGAGQARFLIVVGMAIAHVAVAPLVVQVVRPAPRRAPAHRPPRVHVAGPGKRRFGDIGPAGA